MRFFNGSPLAGSSFDLVVGTDPNARVLQSAEPVTFFSPYVSLPPARYSLRVFKAGDRQTAFKTIDLPLRDKSYYTVLVSQPLNGLPAVELLDETPSPDPDKPSPNRVIVRQYCPNANVIVSGGGKQTETLGYGRVQTLEGFPNGQVPLMVRATLSPGGQKIGSAEADFRINHRATLYVVTDPYGRLRTRMSADGPSVAQEAADAAPSPSPRTP